VKKVAIAYLWGLDATLGMETLGRKYRGGNEQGTPKGKKPEPIPMIQDHAGTGCRYGRPSAIRFAVLRRWRALATRPMKSIVM
jgi:hypothetical protein